MAGKIAVRFMNGETKEFEVIEDPCPHYLVESTKELHGWFNYDFQDHGKRECSQERFLLNPYNGCAVGCEFCYTRGMGTYFNTFWKDGAVAVFKDFDLVVAKQLSRLHLSACGYLSPTTDPFQDVENKYHISQKIIKLFLDNGLPVDFITKRGSNVPRAVFQAIAAHPRKHSFCQFTIFTCRDDVTRRITRAADPFDIQVDAIRRARDNGIENVIARFDPIIPTVTDDPKDLAYMMETVKKAGATHVIMSCLDIPSTKKNVIYEFLAKIGNIDAIKKIYEGNGQMVGKDLNARIDFRRRLFTAARDLATANGLTFSLCMEFNVVTENGVSEFHGLNDEFMTSRACEKVEIPIYMRKNLDEPFQPMPNRCDGNCLNFAKGKGNCHGDCNCAPFMQARSLQLKDYRAAWKLLSG